MREQMDTLLKLSTIRTWCHMGVARAARQAHRLTQGEIADATGCTLSAVSRWERGERLPRERLALSYYEVIAGLLEKEFTG